MALNPNLTKDSRGNWWLNWTADPKAVAYDIVTPNGGHTQSGKNATSPKLGKPTEPFTVQIAPAYSQAYESVSQPPQQPPIPPEPPQPPQTGKWPLPPLLNPTIFCSGNGSDTAAGTLTAPMSLKAAVSKTQPGDVVGMLGDQGVFIRNGDLYPHGGTASEWIQYRPVDGHGAPIIQGKGGTANYNGFAPNGASYLDFRGITFDGSQDKFFAQGIHAFAKAHHIIVAGCKSIQTGAAGIFVWAGGGGCDYCWMIGNQSWRFGDGTGWSSAISLNNGSGIFAFDTAPGFHNLVIGNVFTGGIDMSTADSDGNGIILDLYGAGTPCLIAGNVCYMIGGRGTCIGAGQGVNTTAPVYVVNNTSFKNGLDLRKPGGWGEFLTNVATGTHFHNNIAVPIAGSYAYRMMGSSGIINSKNVGYGGQNYGMTPEFTADPEFAWTPSVQDGVDGQWKNPPKPWELPANAFALTGGSPYVKGGDDLTALAGLDATMKQQMSDWAMVDPKGNWRGNMSLGAYEYVG